MLILCDPAAMATSTQKNFPLAPVTTPWPPMLVMDLALGLDTLDEILLRYDVDDVTWKSLQANLAFRRELVLIRKELSESGTSFKRKAALHAETYLMEINRLMFDNNTPPNIKHDIFKTLVKLGELEPKDTKGSSQGESSAQPQFAINIQINQ